MNKIFRRKDLFLTSEENKVPRTRESKRWRGPPYANKVKQCEILLSFKIRLFIAQISSPKLHNAPLRLCCSYCSYEWLFTLTNVIFWYLYFYSSMTPRCCKTLQTYHEEDLWPSWLWNGSLWCWKCGVLLFKKTFMKHLSSDKQGIGMSILVYLL